MSPVISRRCIELVEMYEVIQIEALVSGLLRSARNDEKFASVPMSYFGYRLY